MLNYGISRSPFLASCLRDIQYFVAEFNIELRAEFIPSKQNYMADLCSRAFSNNVFFNKFNKLLNDGTIMLETLCYDKFNFEFYL